LYHLKRFLRKQKKTILRTVVENKSDHLNKALRKLVLYFSEFFFKRLNQRVEVKSFVDFCPSPSLPENLHKIVADVYVGHTTLLLNETDLDKENGL